MYAANRKLSNLIAFCDNNGMQIDGYTNDINSVEPLVDKWRAFKWNVISCDGHDVEALYNSIQEALKETERPR